MSLLWRNTHCRERRKIEEYSTLEVTDSDNNSIKEPVEFSEPSFRTNFQNLLEVTLESELQIFTSKTELQKKELDFLFCVASLFLCILFERNEALFIAIWEG